MSYVSEISRSYGMTSTSSEVGISASVESERDDVLRAADSLEMTCANRPHTKAKTGKRVHRTWMRQGQAGLWFLPPDDFASEETIHTVSESLGMFFVLLRQGFARGAREQQVSLAGQGRVTLGSRKSVSWDILDDNFEVSSLSHAPGRALRFCKRDCSMAMIVTRRDLLDHTACKW